MDHTRTRFALTPATIMLAYGVVGALFMAIMVLTQAHLTTGAGFVLVTSVLLEQLVRRSTAALVAANDELAHSEEKYRTLFEASPDPMWVFDTVTLRLLAVNPAMADQYGYSQDELLERGLEDLGAAGADGIPAEAGSWRLLTKHGDELFVDVTSHEMVWESRPARLVIARDVTERRLAEGRVRLLEAVVEHAGDAVLVVEVRPPGEENCVIYANASFERITGYPIDAIVGEPIRVVRRVTSDVGARRLDAAFAAGHSAAVELRVQRLDEGEVWVEATLSPLRGDDGQPTHWVCVVRDISERKHAEERLRMREELNRAVLDSLPDRTAVLDAEGRVIAVNEAWLKAADANVPDAGAAGSDYRDALAGTLSDVDVAEARRNLAEVLAGTRTGFELEYETADERAFVLAVAQFTGAGGGAVVTHREVTERRRLEEQLRHSQKMEAVGRLAGGVAHDFNNLLTAILGFAEFAIEGIDADSPVASDLVEVQRAAERGAELTRQLLAFSRRQVLRPAVVDLAEVVRETEGMLRRIIGEEYTLETVIGDGPRTVRADRGQLEQVLLNLVVNAKDAMARGGVVTLAVGASSADAAVLSVRDTGSGMDEDTLTHAFEPFFTTKDPGVGTGLGLPMVYGIVTQSGGTVSLWSEPGRGTEVTIRLPIAQGEPVAAAAPAAPAAIDDARPATVLVVEDEHEVRELLCLILRQQGWKVLDAATAAEAFDRSRTFPGTIDVLVSDIVLPDQRGTEVATVLLTERPELGVVFVSGYAGRALLDDALANPNSVFLPKPFRPRELVEAVREVLPHADLATA